MKKKFSRQHLWNLANPEKYAAQRKRQYDIKLKLVRDFKEESGCVDCKKKFPHFVLDFDHIHGKENCVSRLAGGRSSFALIAAEMKKCDVVCLNCHRIRTWNRKLKRIQK